MNTLLKPTTGLSRVFSDWLRPDSLFDRELFDIESELFPAKLGVNIPSVNIKETPREFTFELAAPGMERKDFNIELSNHSLTISAEKEEKKEEGKEKSDYWRKEYSYNSFTRSFTLPENIKEGNIDAKYENGILIIHVPKAKETPVETPKRIMVK